MNSLAVSITRLKKEQMEQTSLHVWSLQHFSAVIFSTNPGPGYTKKNVVVTLWMSTRGQSFVIFTLTGALLSLRNIVKQEVEIKKHRK